MLYPPTILIEDLLKCNVDYDKDQVYMYQALYDGGQCVDSVKPLLLERRQMEKAGKEVGEQQYQDRLAKSLYIRRISGFIDWMVAAVFLDEPKIVVDESILKDKESREYYEFLNEDADRYGTPLAQLMRDAVLEGCVQRRCYPAIDFPRDKALARDPFSGDARFRIYKACEIEDWEYDHRGQLLWVRWHAEEYLRPENEAWKVPDREVHTWAFINDDQTAIYQATKEIKGDWETKDARLTVLKQYSGGIPAFEIKYRKGQWIMSTCFDAVKAAFNRDSSIEYLGDKFAFQTLVISTDRGSLDDIILADLGAIKLNAGETAGFIAPQPGVLAPLFQSAEKLRIDILDSIHASAQNAASIPQAGRLSGDAVEEMRQPLHVLLYSFAWPVMDAFQKALDRIIAVRGDPEGSAVIEGFEKFEATFDELEKTNAGAGRSFGGTDKDESLLGEAS